MNAFVPHFRVVAGLIERHGRYLITQRSSSGVLAGLWEFPSCQVETGETDETALRRDLRSRVGIEVDVGVAAASRTHSYDGYASTWSSIVPRFRRAKSPSWLGQPMFDG
jgi:mutator protein MutT